MGVYGPTVYKRPIIFAEGTPDSERSFSLFGIGGYSQKEKEAADALFKLSYQKQIISDNVMQTTLQAERVGWERKIQQIKEKTGIEIFNPIAVMEDFSKPYTGPPEGVDKVKWGDRDYKRIYYKDKWAAEARPYLDKNPEYADIFKLDETDDELVMRAVFETEQAYQEAMHSPYLSGWQKTKSELSGSAAGTMMDPFTWLTFAVGAGGRVGAKVLSRIGRVVMTEAAVNAGAEAVTQAANYNWKKDAGIQVSLSDSMKQIGMAGVVGGAFGGVFGGAHEVSRLFSKGGKLAQEAAERVEAGTPTAADIELIAKTHNVPIDDVEKRMLKLAEEQGDLDNAAFGALSNITPEDSASLLERASQAIDDPEFVGPIWGAEYAPVRAADVDRVITETLYKDFDQLTVHGKPVAYERFDPDTLATDAKTYQYKDGGDAAGVTDRLRDVKQWDPTASGKVFVHERADGRYIADGHQRLGLAQRLKAEGDAAVSLDGFVYREADGWTAAEVRGLAAKKNLQEGSGTAMDAARVIRDMPEIVDAGLPVSAPMMKKATNLARLSDDAWGMVVNGVADEHHGAVVGRLVADPVQQASILADIARIAPETERQTEMLVREMQAAGFRHETQTDMFGSRQVQQSLMMERVNVLDEALKALRQDKKLFGTLSENADIIAAAGNQLDEAGNLSRAVNAETLSRLIEKLARTRGTISDALTEAAKRFADGSTAKKEARRFVSNVEKAIKEKGISRLLQGEEPQVLKPAIAMEPADKAGVEFAEMRRLESGGGSEPKLDVDGQPDVWDFMPDSSYVDDMAKAKKIEITANIIKRCKR